MRPDLENETIGMRQEDEVERDVSKTAVQVIFGYFSTKPYKSLYIYIYIYIRRRNILFILKVLAFLQGREEFWYQIELQEDRHQQRSKSLKRSK